MRGRLRGGPRAPLPHSVLAALQVWVNAARLCLSWDSRLRFGARPTRIHDRRLPPTRVQSLSRSPRAHPLRLTLGLNRTNPASQTTSPAQAQPVVISSLAFPDLGPLNPAQSRRRPGGNPHSGLRREHKGGVAYRHSRKVGSHERCAPFVCVRARQRRALCRAAGSHCPGGDPGGCARTAERHLRRSALLHSAPTVPAPSAASQGPPGRRLAIARKCPAGHTRACVHALPGNK